MANILDSVGHRGLHLRAVSPAMVVQKQPERICEQVRRAESQKN